MNKFGFKLLLLLICLCSAAQPSFGWDAVGHKLTTSIAWEHMTPEVRARVIRILLDAPEDSDLSTPYDAYNSRSTAIKQLELFMYASIWSDVIRDRKFDLRYKNYHHGDWHYADTFWKQENGDAVVLVDFPEESGKAIYKLVDFEKVLRDSSTKTEDKAIALAWFLHISGDIHNPVHNASRVTTDSPKGDQGGNRFVLQKQTDDQRGVNLHGYWDSIIGNVIPRKNDACDSDYLAPIARKLMKKYPYSKVQNRLRLGEFKAWNLEGFDLLNKVVYQDVTRYQMPSKGYRRRAFEVAGEQIALAGYRLGETLNQIFKKDDKAVEKQTAKTSEKSEINGQEAMAIWNKVKSVFDNIQTFKYIKVEIKNTTVILSGIVSSVALKRRAVNAIKNVEGVTEVIDNIRVDESISPEIAESEVKMSRTISAETIRKNPVECKIIRKVLYPVSKRRTPEQKMRIALLDVCPPNKGMMARPIMGILFDGEPIFYEYDVIRVFETEKEAKEYAASNKITDVSYE